jgi:hypothetical protein
MKFHVFAVYDSKTSFFLPPFMVPHRAIAARSFKTAANDPAQQINHHPQDFTLFEIAEYDDTTGTYNNLPHHINHGLAADYREQSA